MHCCLTQYTLYWTETLSITCIVVWHNNCSLLYCNNTQTTVKISSIHHTVVNTEMKRKLLYLFALNRAVCGGFRISFLYFASWNSFTQQTHEPTIQQTQPLPPETVSCNKLTNQWSNNHDHYNSLIKVKIWYQLNVTGRFSCFLTSCRALCRSQPLVTRSFFE